MIAKIESSKIACVKILIGMLLALSLITVSSCSQKKLAKSPDSLVKSEQTHEKVYQEVEQMPEFPGGNVELRNYLMHSVKYPVDAMKNKIQGKVFVSFVITKDGSVKDARVVRGADPLLDAESVRVVNSMPKWTPGKEKGKTVAVSFTLPIDFKLQ